MKISSKGEYGLRALFDLAQHYEKSTRRSREIGEAQKVPEDYLNQLLIYLRKAGLITSLRGPQGGHVLARPPSKITLYDVLRALEGDLSPIANEVEKTTVDTILGEVWDNIESETTRILQATSLADLCERYNFKYKDRDEVMYYI